MAGAMCAGLARSQVRGESEGSVNYFSLHNSNLVRRRNVDCVAQRLRAKGEGHRALDLVGVGVG
eukprot:scaffold84724_cov75-Phaeocystis_antarctica.AAC.1